MVIVLALVALAALLLAIAHAACGKPPIWISVLLLAFVVLVQLALLIWR